MFAFHAPSTATEIDFVSATMPHAVIHTADCSDGFAEKELWLISETSGAICLHLLVGAVPSFAEMRRNPSHMKKYLIIRKQLPIKARELNSTRWCRNT